MASLSNPAIECVEQSETFGRFVAEPLEKGFGTTLGNGLRRVLLRYLPGAAVTSVHIEGIHHEFAPIPDVKEDVLDLLLNIKALRLKSITGHPGKLVLEKEGAGEIHASDITPSMDFEVINPDLYLATIDSDQGKLYVEMDAEIGMGYQSAEAGANLLVGTIPVDAIFTPVRKVNFTTEPMHFGRETSQERLVLEVWTDGTINPARAVSRAATLLIEQFKPFVEYGRISQADEEKQNLRTAIPEEIFNMPVEKLDLSVRSMNCLRRGGITTVGNLLSMDEKEIASLRNFGQKSRQEVEEKLQSLGVAFSYGAPAEEPVEAKPARKKKTE